MLLGNSVLALADGDVPFSAVNRVLAEQVLGAVVRINENAGPAATENRIEDNTILDSGKHGIRLYGDARANRLTDNRITNTTFGVTVETRENELRGNRTQRTNHGLVLTGAASGNMIAVSYTHLTLPTTPYV